MNGISPIETFKRQKPWVKATSIAVTAVIVIGINYAALGAVRGMASHPPRIVADQREAKSEAQYIAEKQKEIERRNAASSDTQEEQKDQPAKSDETEIKALVGKTVAEAEAEASSLGYTVTYLAENTGFDMTADIRTLGVEGDWTVTKVGKIDTSSKTATLYVISTEAAEADREAESIRDALTEKFSPSYAWGAVEMYGLSQYPYGFKRKSMLAEEPHDENTWFLKGTCEIKNEYGTKMKNLTFEALVTGTSDDPQVIEFYVY